MFQLAQVAVTRYHRLSGLNNGNLLLTVLEVGKFKTEVLVHLVLGESPFYLVCRWHFSPCILTWWKAEKEKKISPVSSYEDTNVTMRAPFMVALPKIYLLFIYLPPKDSISKYHQVGVLEFQDLNLEVTQTSRL